MDDYERFKVIRPIPPNYEKEKFGIPVIKKQILKCDWNHIKYSSLSNFKSITDHSRTILSSFQYDYSLQRLWNNPAKYISKFSGLFAVMTPDFSVYTDMEMAEIIHNVYMNRWLGCFWQYMGIRIIPTISWGSQESYDVCFSGIERGSIVAISTVGISNNLKEFMDGYNEMIRRIKPQLIIVRGKYIKGMTGHLLLFDFEETFNIKKQYEQLSINEIPRDIYIGGDYNGWKRK